MLFFLILPLSKDIPVWLICDYKLTIGVNVSKYVSLIMHWQLGKAAADNVTLNGKKLVYKVDGYSSILGGLLRMVV